MQGCATESARLQYHLSSSRTRCSSSAAIVDFDRWKPTEELLTSDVADFRSIIERQFLWRPQCSGHSLVAESLMRSVFVEEANVFLTDVIEMSQTEAYEVVQTFAFDRADPSFRKRIRVRCQERRPQAAHAGMGVPYILNPRPSRGNRRPTTAEAKLVDVTIGGDQNKAQTGVQHVLHVQHVEQRFRSATT